MEQTPKHRGSTMISIDYASCHFLHRHISFRSITSKQVVLLIFTVVLLYASFIVPQQNQDARASNTNYACGWHLVSAGQTLGQIAHYYHANIWSIARTNHVRNINLIFIGQRLCIPHLAKQQNAISGLQVNGQVRWYAYNALESANRGQVEQVIREVAARYNLPTRMMLAIAWQESGWTQHVIARDGGIGTMQIMPYTAQLLNKQVRGHYDPYKLHDNIELAAIYLRLLWRSFNGDQTKIISAYNEGGWNVLHRGIFNWHYVNNVSALMSRF
jgi:soluble lytic murein transglycosylase-like protein